MTATKDIMLSREESMDVSMRQEPFIELPADSRQENSQGGQCCIWSAFGCIISYDAADGGIRELASLRRRQATAHALGTNLIVVSSEGTAWFGGRELIFEWLSRWEQRCPGFEAAGRVRLQGASLQQPGSCPVPMHALAGS